MMHSMFALSGQVCHFQASPVADVATLLRRLRLTLPTALFARRLEVVPEAFHSRLSSCGKRYSYSLSMSSEVMPLDARQCWICGALDLEAMRNAVEVLHKREFDYSAFAMGEHEPEYHGPVVKTVELVLKSEGEKVFILAECDRFLYKMVMLSRNLGLIL